MENPETMATQDEEKQNNNNVLDTTVCKQTEIR